MKIVLLARYLPAEGSTTHMYSVAENLVERGHTVYMLSRGPGKDASAMQLYHQIKSRGVNFITLPFPLYNKINLITQFNQLLHYLFAVPIALFYFFKLKPDVIHAHYPVTTYLASIYRGLTGKKFIVTYHNMHIPRHLLNRKADYAIAISRELEEDLVANYGYQKTEVVRIYNGVKDRNCILMPQGIQNLKKAYHIPLEPMLFGFVGTLNHRKGIDVFLKAMQRCAHLNVHGVILGDGKDKAMENFVREHHLEERLTFIPFRDPSDIYNMMDVLILPSRVEGFPLVPLEAMMMKTPVIRSNIEGAKDQIQDGVNGYLFESEDDDELAKIIEELSSDPKRLSLMGEHAFAHVKGHFSEDMMVDKMLKVYRRTL